ncbi:MAG TPA: hypothetical protein VF599_23070 [Pyrinomonadaceae bacterium]|jgi:hypothetical protein
MIYSAGRDCPICFDSSDIVFLKNTTAAAKQIFFACYACGCAWSKPPAKDEDFDILTPQDFAPEGFELAGLSDIKLAELDKFISVEYSEILSQQYSSGELMAMFR